MYRGNCIDNDAEDNFDAAADDDDNDDESLQEISLSLSLLESFYPSGPTQTSPRFTDNFTFHRSTSDGWERQGILELKDRLVAGGVQVSGL